MKRNRQKKKPYTSVLKTAEKEMNLKEVILKDRKWQKDEIDIGCFNK